MIRAIEQTHFLLAGECSRRSYGVHGGFCPGIAENDVIDARARFLDDIRQYLLRGTGDAKVPASLDLLGQGFLDNRWFVAEHQRAEPAGKVNIFISINIGEVWAFSALDVNGMWQINRPDNLLGQCLFTGWVLPRGLPRGSRESGS